MGNEQSKPGAEADTQSAGSEKENFDLNAIEDNRQHLAKSSPVPHTIPATNTDMARGKRKSKRNRKKESTSSVAATEKEGNGTTPPTASESPVDDLKLVETLSKREPEQFGIYDSASDNSEDEDDKSEVFYSTKWPPGSLTGTKSETPEEHSDQDDSRKGSSAQIESDVDNEIPSDQDNANEDDPETNIQVWKRVPCPYAEEHECTKMFTSKYHATRHGKSHDIALVCPVCDKVLRRQDTYDRHVKRHSPEELAEVDEATLGAAHDAEDNQDTEEPDGAESLSEADEMDVDSHEPEPVREQRFSCPLAASFDCSKTYLTQNAADEHAKSHTTDFSCPVGCIDPKTQAIKTFATKGSQTRHLKKRHTEEERRALRSAGREATGDAPTLQNEQTQPEENDEAKEGPKETVQEASPQDPPNEPETVLQPDEEGPTIDDFDGTNLSDAHQDRDQDEAGSHITADAIIDTSIEGEGNEAEAENQQEAEIPHSEHELSHRQFTRQESKKRKRGRQSSSPAAGSKKSAKKRKQAERTPTPPNEEVEEQATGSKFAGVFIGTPNKSRTSEGPQPTERRQSTINKFAQPYTAGSKLRHPLFHPESPGKRKRGQATSSDVELEQEDTQTSLRKKRKITGSTGLPSRKGKERAVSEDENEDDDPTDEHGLATPVAKEGVLSSKPKSRSASRTDMFDLDDSDQDFEDDVEPDNEKSKTRKLVTSKGIVCRVCKRVYKNQTRLNRHMNDPKSHRNLLDCEDCDEKFYHTGALSKHKKATGHGQEAEDEGARGRFTVREEASIKRWVGMFCQEHDLTKDEFQQIMQASFRRGIEWRYKFMSKQDFNDEYFDVLPNRDKRSMRRYRNWNFNTTDTSKSWSKEEDDDIIRLHEELGPRWNRIGREIDRSGEMVRQRWKVKLQTANMEHGFWTKLEQTAFVDAIQDVKAVTEVSSGSFNWTAVSKIIQTRTPQQCANHWRAKYAGTKKGDIWKTLGDITPATTPLASRSKMEQRLAGKLKSSPRRRKVISEEHIKESDDEDEVKAACNDDPSEGSSKRRKSERKSTKSEDEVEDEEDITRPPESDPGPEDADDEVDDSRLPKSDSESDEDRDENTQPKLPRHPLAGITPGKTLTASQAFNQTQANTSAKRFSARKGSLGPSQERPSPPLSIRNQRVRSPELGTPDSELNDNEANHARVSDVQGENKENVPQHDGQLDDELSSDEERPIRIEPQIKVSLVDSEAEETSFSESEDDDASTESESGSEPESESTYETSAAKQASASASASRAKTTSGSEPDSESGSSSRSESDSDLESQPTSPPPHQKSTPSNKKLAQISNDFMSSIHEASLKRKQQARKPVSKWTDESSESEDDGRMPSQTLPVMRRR